uniref:Uncharacterized protein n=1 Tax=Arundo donax TaxID=35708 RepID=A0A0A9CC94_ARUDO
MSKKGISVIEYFVVGRLKCVMRKCSHV